MTPPGTYTGWSMYWLCWLLGSFALFIGPELYGLRTDSNRTLSAAVWRLEAFRQGQPVADWTFGHFAFITMFALMGFWLIFWLSFHFGFGWWR